MKIVPFVLIALVLTAMPAFAHSESDHSDFSDIENLIENPVDCDQLTEEQLERIGDYFMEQMHPGEAHERMDAMMGGEGSESLEQMHIRMAFRFYCQGQYINTRPASDVPGGYGMMGHGMGLFQTGFGMHYMPMPHFALMAGFAPPFGFMMVPFLGF